MDKFVFDKKALLDTNLKIDKTFIENNEDLEKKLSEIGVQTKPKYTLSHPLTTTNACFIEKQDS